MRTLNEKNTWKTANWMSVTARKTIFGKKTRKIFLMQGYDPRVTGSSRIRKRFDNQTEAQAEADRINAEILAHIHATPKKPQLTQLTAEEIADAEAANAIIGDTGKKLSEVVSEWKQSVDKLTEKHPKMTLSHAISLLIAQHKEITPITTHGAYESYLSLKKSECSQKTVEEVVYRLRRLVELEPNKLISQWSTAEVQEAARLGRDGSKLKNTTINNNLRTFFGFFEFCKKNNYTSDNPVANTHRPRKEKNIPQILSVEQILSLLTQVAKEPEIKNYIYLLIFQGLRPSEAAALKHTDINLIEGVIDINVGKMGGRMRRQIQITDSFKSFYVPDSPIRYDRHLFDKVRKLAGLMDDWVPDVTRHTWISAHLTLFRDESQTAREAGHLNAYTTKSKYYNIMKPSEAQAFWDLRANNLMTPT